MEKWEVDLRESKRLFLKLVWSTIQDHCGGGRLEAVEGVENPTAKTLDIYGGVDFWIRQPSGLCCLASRVQSNSDLAQRQYEYNTFTIRDERESGVDTEYQKRMEAIRTGKHFYPYLQSHAYVQKTVAEEYILTCAVARTEDLYRYIYEREVVRGDELPRKKSYDEKGWSRFVVVHWQKLHKASIGFFAVNGEGNRLF